jgi:FixJ family two-component response regulator
MPEEPLGPKLDLRQQDAEFDHGRNLCREPIASRPPLGLHHTVTVRVYRIAVVDDDASIRKALSSLLRSMGYAVALFDSGEAFLAAPESGDCVITDLQMPGMSGLDLLERLREHGIDTPVIVITAFPEPAVRQRALQLGARAFFSKPFDAGAILAEIEAAILPR